MPLKKTEGTIRWVDYLDGTSKKPINKKSKTCIPDIRYDYEDDEAMISTGGQELDALPIAQCNDELVEKLMYTKGIVEYDDNDATFRMTPIAPLWLQMLMWFCIIVFIVLISWLLDKVKYHMNRTFLKRRLR